MKAKGKGVKLCPLPAMHNQKNESIYSVQVDFFGMLAVCSTLNIKNIKNCLNKR